VDLVTPDTEAATAFYTGLFGWHANVDSPDGHTMLNLGDRPVAALMPHVAEAPADTPALWTTYVSVADVDATAARARELGGTVSVPPSDIPTGRFAILGDPQGGFFSVIRLNG
jgi:predicted enzyme related to lactoylglutathione lyase